MPYRGSMEFEFVGEVIECRGPAPYLFVATPAEVSAELRERPELSYGWGCIATHARIGETEFDTSLMPRGGTYLVPVKVVVQRAEDVGLGDVVTIGIRVAERAT